MRKENISSLIETKRNKPIHHKRKSVFEVHCYESTLNLSLIPSVVAKLNANGMKDSFAIFTFDTQVVTEGQSDNTLNLQYAIEDGVVGLEWPLCRARNIADKQRFIKYITERGCKVSEHIFESTGREFNDWTYLRIEEGNIVDLGMRILTELYQLQSNAEISLLVDGFEKPSTKMADVMHFVRQSVNQQEFAADVERISAVLRMVHGKTKSNEGDYAFAEIKTFLGSIQFTDMDGDESNHTFCSTILTEPRAKRHEEEPFGAHGINLLSTCGYHHLYTTENTYDKWFTVTNDNDFRKLAELCVGILHLLFDHQPGQPLEIDFFMPCPDSEKLPNREHLPELLQPPYGAFRYDFHIAMAKFHELMTIQSPTLTKSQENELAETYEKIENTLEEYPSWIQKLKKLGASYGNFYSYAIDQQTELIESLNVLHRRYSKMICH